MDTEYLSYVLTITRRKNMAKAAEKLYVSQSSLSQYLSGLEQEIGDPLFIRTKGELLPTPAEGLYVEATRKVIRIQKDLYQNMRSLNNKSRVTIGVTPQFGLRMLTEIIPACEKEFLQVVIEISKSSVPVFTRMLLNERIDCVIMALNGTDVFSGEQVLILWREGVLFAIPVPYEYRKHSQNSAMTQEELIREFGKGNFMLSKKGSTLRVLADRIFAACDFQPNTMCETNSIIATRAMVAKGIGVTFIVSSCISDRGSVAYYSLDLKLYRCNVLMLRKNLIQSRPEGILFQYIYDYFRE